MDEQMPRVDADREMHLVSLEIPRRDGTMATVFLSPEEGLGFGEHLRALSADRAGSSAGAPVNLADALRTFLGRDPFDDPEDP